MLEIFENIKNDMDKFFAEADALIEKYGKEK